MSSVPTPASPSFPYPPNSLPMPSPFTFYSAVSNSNHPPVRPMLVPGPFGPTVSPVPWLPDTLAGQNGPIPLACITPTRVWVGVARYPVSMVPTPPCGPLHATHSGPPPPPSAVAGSAGSTSAFMAAQGRNWPVEASPVLTPGRFAIQSSTGVRLPPLAHSPLSQIITPDDDAEAERGDDMHSPAAKPDAAKPKPKPKPKTGDKRQFEQPNDGEASSSSVLLTPPREPAKVVSAEDENTAKLDTPESNDAVVVKPESGLVAKSEPEVTSDVDSRGTSTTPVEDNEPLSDDELAQKPSRAAIVKLATTKRTKKPSVDESSKVTKLKLTKGTRGPKKSDKRSNGGGSAAPRITLSVNSLPKEFQDNFFVQVNQYEEYLREKKVHGIKHGSGTGLRYTCNLCGAAFQQQKHVSRHAVQHFSHRPFSCMYCSEDFSRADSLIRHVARSFCNPHNKS